MMSILKRTVKEHIISLRNKEYSALELCRAYTDEILRKDSAYYSSFLYIDTAAVISSAKKADKILAEGETPLLCGIPFAAKDNICTKGIMTSAGSGMLQYYKPPYDATVISRLKAQGAVLLGKTNMDEFAMGSTTETSAFGATSNPANRRLSPGGSSGGSAAAVAADLTPFALGSDTGGSVRCPAAFCGCVGLCPTYGTLSRYGLIAFASSLDRIGLLTKTCADSAAVFSSLLGKDKNDATSLDHSLPSDIKGNARGLRIGLPVELFSDEISDEVKSAVLSAAERFRELGARVFEISLPSLRFATQAYYIISSAEASSNLARYDGIRFANRSADGASSLDDFYKRNRSEGFGDEVKRRIMLGTFVLSEGSYESYYKKALSVRCLIREDYSEAFEKCDLILSPTAPSTAYPLSEERTDPTLLYMQDLCTVSQNLAGICAISIPCQREGRLPIGLQLTAPALGEALLYKAGIAFEEGNNE